MPENTRILEALLAEPWLIESAALRRMQLIAERHLDAPELLAVRDGQPLDNSRSVEVFGATAVIPVRGPIFRYANLFTRVSGATSLEVLAKDFATAADTPQIKRIILALDTPGGQSTGIAELAEIIRGTKKPVTAYVGDLAASAGYWLASAADQIVTSPTGVLGSIGVVGTYRPSDGQEIEIISSQSPLKRADPRTEAGRGEMQRVVDDLAAVFVSSVARYRGVSEDTVLSDFGRGGLLVGEKAVLAGMADAVGTLEALIHAGDGKTIVGYTMAEQPTTQAPEITREYLAAHHPDIVASFQAEGAEHERERIQSVRAQSIPGHEALIDRLAFDGHTTGPQAAVQVLAAERELRAEATRRREQETPPPVSSVERTAPTGPGENQAEETFDDKLNALMAEGKTRPQAMRLAVFKHPDLHKAWLARINDKQAS